MFEGNDFYGTPMETTWHPGRITDIEEVRIVDQGSQSHGQEEVATDSILAPDERDAVSPLVPDDGIKRPPTEPPETTLSPDEFPEEGDGNWKHSFASLGEIASENVELSTAAMAEELYSELHPNFEVVQGEEFDLVLNRGHADQALVDAAAARLAEGSVWHESEQIQYPERTYHVDDLETPTYFTKTTMFALDDYREMADGINELIISQDVKTVINSEQAQLVAREQGFEGIDFVEPLVTAVSVELDAAVTVYPWQYGQLTPLADGGELEVPAEVAHDELDRVRTVAQDLHALFGANGIEAPDLGVNQILIEDNRLVLIDVEEYRKFETPEAALVPSDSAHFKDNQWHPGGDPVYAREDMPEMTTVEEGTAGIARGAEADSGVSPEFYAEWQGGSTVVALWNAVTKESAVVHAANHAQLESTVSQVFAKMPNVNRPGTILHLFGEDTWVAYGRLFDGVTLRNPVSLEGTTDIYLNTATGRIETYDEDGNQTFTYQPPSTRRGE